MTRIEQTKSFAISKDQVWQAYQKVKANRGAAGVDKQSLKEFEVNLSGNLYKLWNRMASGSYFPPPVLGVEIEKKGGHHQMKPIIIGQIFILTVVLSIFMQVENVTNKVLRLSQ